MSYEPIESYGIIGNSRTAALISRSGSLDWMCLPRFDGPTLFAALLDSEKGGSFRVGPSGAASVERRYLCDTAILETTFSTDSGVFRLTDLMPVRSEGETGATLWPDHAVLRVIEGLEGTCDCEVRFAPRADYAQGSTTLRDRGPLGISLEHSRGACNLRSDIRLTLSQDRSLAEARLKIHAGERFALSLAFSDEEPTVLAPLGEQLDAQIDQTNRWWRDWVARCSYDGPYRDAVYRSAITLKLLTFAPSGAPIAAPTTSLPEEIGGERNWDYRYCWLRDASLTVRALLDLNYRDEAQAFLSWMLHATRLSEPDLQVLYDVYGETRLEERELSHLEGYRRSRPVRVGNQAAGQLQLDIYGEVINAAYEYVRSDGRLDRASARRLEKLGDVICARSLEPDEGIWEVRSGRRHHTYSKAMCWIGLDRLRKLHTEGHVSIDAERVEAEMDQIRESIEQRGYSDSLDSYVSTFDGEGLDASLALLGIYDYSDPAGERMLATSKRLRERLGTGALLHRYRDADDGLRGGEGAFGICSFWGVELRALAGDREGALADFEEILGFANDLGLFAEEIDPVTGAALGNFPQAFTHVGLINAAATLAGLRGRGQANAEGAA